MTLVQIATHCSLFVCAYVYCVAVVLYWLFVAEDMLCRVICFVGDLQILLNVNVIREQSVDSEAWR